MPVNKKESVGTIDSLIIGNNMDCAPMIFGYRYSHFFFLKNSNLNLNVLLV